MRKFKLPEGYDHQLHLASRDLFAELDPFPKTFRQLQQAYGELGIKIADRDLRQKIRYPEESWAMKKWIGDADRLQVYADGNFSEVSLDDDGGKPVLEFLSTRPSSTGDRYLVKIFDYPEGGQEADSDSSSGFAYVYPF